MDCLQNVENIAKYAKLLHSKGYLTSGYIAVKECKDGSNGIRITEAHADFDNIGKEETKFVDDKNIAKLEGNFRAAAVILLCALRQDKHADAAAIVDSDSILAYSKKRVALGPVLDDMAQVCGISVKCASKNVAAEIIPSLGGLRNACFMPDAGAIVTGRTLEEVYTCALVLDKACNCALLADAKGGAKTMPKLNALLEHVVYKLKYSKTNQKQQAAQEGGEVKKEDDKQCTTAIVTDEEKRIAKEIKDAGLRMLEEKLVQGTWGNIAVKLDDTHMLATPSGIDYILLEPEQIAKVNLDTLEWEGLNKATSEKGMHAVLLKGEGIGATMHSHPFYGCILAAMDRALPVPEKYRDILGDEIPCAAAALPGTKKLIKNVESTIGDAPACFLAHHGVIARGKDLEDAFRIYRALEDACRDYLLDAQSEEPDENDKKTV